MLQKDKIATTVICLSLAIGIGHLMQNEPAVAAARPDVSDTQPTTFTPSLASGMPLAPFVMSQDMTLAHDASFDPHHTVMTASATPHIAPDIYAPLSARQAQCTTALTSATRANAMVEITASAPCLAHTHVTFEHDGLSFSQSLDAQGEAVFQFPALSQMARFSARFSNGAEHSTSSYVDSVDAYERVAMAWVGTNDLNLHVFDEGAQFGELGHVWVESDAVSRDASAVFDFGGNPDRALARLQVYSAPLTNGSLQNTDFVVEAEITADSCDRHQRGFMRLGNATSHADALDFSISMPSCDDLGGFIQLKNNTEELKLALK